MPESDAMGLHAFVQPLRGMPADLDAAIEAVRGKQYVLIGEATHGTHEF